MQKNKAALKPIGGYLELELPKGNEYYPDLVRLNTGRNALEYILIQKNIIKFIFLISPAMYCLNQLHEQVFNTSFIMLTGS